MNRREEAAFGDLPRTQGPDEGSTGRREDSCPDENLLAGFVEDSLLEHERATVVPHLESCSDCREIVRSIRAEPDSPAQPGSPGKAPDEKAPSLSRRTAARIALAASLLVIAGWWLIGKDQGGDSSTETQRDSQTHLEASLEKLRASDPSSFGEFNADPRDWLRSMIDSHRDEDRLSCLEPSALIREGRPVFRWRGARHSGPFEISLWNQTPSQLWRLEVGGNSLPFPEKEASLEPGEIYVWTLRSARLRESEISNTFSVATAEELERLDRGLAAIQELAFEDRAPDTSTYLRGVFRAHCGFFAEAETELTELSGHQPDFPHLNEILSLLRANLAGATLASVKSIRDRDDS